MSFADIPKLSDFEPDDIQHEQEVVAERQAHARDLIEKLSDSGFAVRHRFLRLVSLPSDKTKTLIEVLTTERDSVAVERILHSTIAAVSFERGNDLQFDFLTEKFHSRKTDGGEFASIALAFDSYDTVLTVRSVPLPGLAAGLVDQKIDLTILEPCDIQAAFDRRYGENPVELMGFVWPVDLPFASLDIACAKSACPADAITVLRSIAGDVVLPEAPKPLGHLWGYGGAGAWAQILVDELAAYRKGQLVWGDLDTGILLIGPPGTGKTQLARRVAAAAGIPLFATSYSEWQSAGDGHLGDVLRAIRKTFEKAAANTPSVVFIDEIDSLPRRGEEKKDASWFWAVVNALLESVDGAKSREGIVVMAAANHLSRIDPALVRPGRLNRVIEVSRPDGEALAHIIAELVDGSISADDLLPLAALMAGTMTGADAGLLVADARRLARNRREPVSLTDLEAVAFPTETRDDKVLWHIGVHEAGHILAAMAQGEIPILATVVQRNGTHGQVQFAEPAPTIMTRTAMQSDLVKILAGRAAEEIIFGEPSAGSGGTATSDLALATSKAAAMMGVLGFDGLVYDISPQRGGVETVLRAAYASASTLMARHESALRALARLLIDRRTLLHSDLEDFAREHGLAGMETAAMEVLL